MNFKSVVIMEALSCNQKYLKVFGYCRKADDTVDNTVFLTRVAIFYITLVQALIPSICYPFFHSDEPEVFINSLIPIIGFLITPISYLTFFIEDKNVLNTLVYIRSLVHERKNCLHSHEIFNEYRYS